MSNTTSISSGLLTADSVIADRRSQVVGVQIITDKTNDVTLILYDNASAATGTELFKQQITGTDDSLAYWFGDSPIRASAGIYADVTGTGAEYIVFYK